MYDLLILTNKAWDELSSPPEGICQKKAHHNNHTQLRKHQRDQMCRCGPYQKLKF